MADSFPREKSALGIFCRGRVIGQGFAAQKGKNF